MAKKLFFMEMIYVKVTTANLKKTQNITFLYIFLIFQDNTLKSAAKSCSNEMQTQSHKVGFDSD